MYDCPINVLYIILNIIFYKWKLGPQVSVWSQNHVSFTWTYITFTGYYKNIDSIVLSLLCYILQIDEFNY